MDDDDRFRWTVRTLAHVAGELTLAWCAGSAGCHKRFKWTHAEAQPGELVVEMSTHHFDQGLVRGGHTFDHFNRIGRYLGPDVVERSWEDDPGETWIDEGALIVLADGTIFRWTNCDLRRVPEETLSGLTSRATEAGLSATSRSPRPPP